MKEQLTPRTLCVLKSLCLLRLASSAQLAHYIYKPKSPNPIKATRDMMYRLHSRGFVSRTIFYSGLKPEYIWYITQKNLENIKSELSKKRKADAYEELFCDGEYELRSAAKLQQNTLAHELGISEFFLGLTHGIKQTGLTIPIWLNTSPSHPLFSLSVEATMTAQTTGKSMRKKLPVNPDGFFMIRNDKETTFYFLEYDNNTETQVAKITNKFIAYSAFNAQKIFKTAILPTICKNYGIEVNSTDRIGVRVLFVTTTENRRDDLFIKATRLPTGNLFLFTTIEEISARPFDAHWLSKKEFKPYFENYWNLAQPASKKQLPATPSVLRNVRSEAIQSMGRVAIP